MFDVGFWELILIAIMGLVILGPERLPVAIRTVRGWISGARKFSDAVKTELTEELRVHELHENLKKAEAADLQNLSPEVAESLKTLKEAAASVNEPFKKVNRQALDDMISDSLASAEEVRGNESQVNAEEETEQKEPITDSTSDINRKSLDKISPSLNDKD